MAAHPHPPVRYPAPLYGGQIEEPSQHKRPSQPGVRWPCVARRHRKVPFPAFSAAFSSHDSLLGKESEGEKRRAQHLQL